MLLELDTLFADKYRIVRLLAEGGMGVVYVAEQISTGRLRALKTMHAHLAQDPRLRERFEQEARIGGRIRSKHVVEVIDADIDAETDMPWLAMELLEGETLDERIELGAPLSLDELRSVFEQLCHAVGEAHKLGIVHRDLKPENIFLAAPPQVDVTFVVKVLDFGIAKWVRDASTTAKNSLKGVGSPGWMAPEQLSLGADITARTDVWALGLIAFRALTRLYYWKSANEPLWDNMAILAEAARADTATPASVRAAELIPDCGLPGHPLERVWPLFDDWFKRCVSRDLSGRYADADEAWRGLRSVLESSPEPPAQLPSTKDLPSAVAAEEAKARARNEATRTAEGNRQAAWREPLTGMSFVWVPPGQFLMGSSREPNTPGFHADAHHHETPAHEIRLPHGVWTAEHPVTNAQYGAFLAETGRASPAFWQTPRFNGAEQPVVGVSFEGALAFCAWLTERAKLQNGRCFDLPTEAEWEHAARGSDGRTYPWGEESPTPELACFGQRGEGGAPAKVGGRPAGKSPFGCCDMAGNVWEWCLDAWGSYGNTMTTLVDPYRPGDPGAPRVIRGGAWFDDPWRLRCAFRGKEKLSLRESIQIVGLRVVCRGSRQPWLVDP